MNTLKNKLKEFWQEHKLILLCISLVSIALSVSLLMGQSFINDADQYLQYNIFYDEWADLIYNFLHGEGLPMYSWNSFLGTDFYSSKAYYLVGDIFMPMIYIFDKYLHNLELGLFIKSILCLYIAGISFNLFLKEYGIKEQNVRNMAAITYAMSGASILFFGQYMFHGFYSMLPMMFYGFMVFIHHKKSTIFITSVTVLYLQCYYMMFASTVFLGLFAIHVLWDKGYKINDIIKQGFNVLSRYLIGVMISSILVVPAALTLLSNPRVGVSGEYGLFFPLEINVRYILDWVNLNTSNFVNLGEYTLSGFLLFIGILPLIAALNYVIKKENRSALVVLLIMSMCLLFMPASSVLHAFSEPTSRWLYLLVFYMIYLGAKGLEGNQNYKKVLIVYLIAYVIAAACTYTLDIDAESMNILTGLYITSFITSIVIYIIYTKNKKLAIMITILQLCSTFVVKYYQKNPEYQWFTVSRNENLAESIDYYRSMDEDLIYRYKMDKSHDLNFSNNANYAMTYKYMGLETYDTIYDANIQPFIDLFDFEFHIFEFTDPDILTMLGVKYYIVYDESELPEDVEFEYVYNLQHLKVYQSADYKGFGYTTNQLKYFSELSDFSEFVETVFVDDETIDLSVYENVVESSFSVYEKGHNYLKGNISSESDNLLFIPIPNNAGWKVLVNGVETDTISVNGGFMGVPITSGDNQVELYFMSYGFKTGAMISAFGFMLFAGSFIYERKKTKK
ncbi:MAG: YfhO family protein [Erysipelotrichaceae bacterium]